MYVDALDGYAFGATFGCVLGLAVYALQRGIFARDVRVDAEGVHLGRGTLPAGAVGDVRILPAARAREAYGGTIDDVAVSWRRNAHGGAWRWPGVLMVDRRGGRRPGWLLRTRRPEELQAAIRTVAGLPALARTRRAPR